MSDTNDSINTIESDSKDDELCLNKPQKRNLDVSSTGLNESKKPRVSNDDSEIEIITIDSDSDDPTSSSTFNKKNDSEPEIIEISDTEPDYSYNSYKPIDGMLSMKQTSNGQKVFVNSWLNDQDDDIIIAYDKPASNPSKIDKNDLKAHFAQGLNQRQTNKNYTYETQINTVIEPIFKSMELKPDTEQKINDFQSPKSLKVNLLPHQKYSIKWLEWRENEYPHGAILADDMGLGKTLTILTYLRTVKDKYEKEYKEKNNIKDEEDDQEPSEKENEFDAFKYLTKLKKKHIDRDDLNVKKLKTLIVLPASLLHQWQGEIQNKFEKNAFKVHVYHEGDRKKYSFNLENNDIVFTTYEIISREVTVPDKEGHIPKSDSPLVNIKWKRIILDEAHRIKNHSTKANKAMCTLKARYRIAITGTPVHNSLNDLYSLVKFLHFEPLDDFGLWKYLFSSETISKSLSNENSVERETRVGFWLKFLSDFLILRRTKKDKFLGTNKCIVDLPDKKVEEIRFKLNETENVIYQKIFKESQDKVNKFLDDHQNRLIGVASGNMGRKNNVSEIFVYLLRLRQACCHMSLLAECLDKAELENHQFESDEPQHGSMKSSYYNNSDFMCDSDSNDSLKTNDLESVKNLSNENLLNCLKVSYMSSKIDKSMSMIIDLLNEYPEDKIILVSQWTSVLSIIGRNLKKRDIDYCEIKGDVMLVKRNEIVENFNDKANLSLRVMLLSLTAGGVGLNLIGANRMFLLDIHWNPALEQQCADRIYRVGQTKNVTVYKMLCEETIEERIQQIQQAKIQIAERVCRSGPESAVPGVPANTRLTIKDFRLLFKDFDTK